MLVILFFCQFPCKTFQQLVMHRVFSDVISLTRKQTSNMASEVVEVSTSQLKVKKCGGQFCVAGGQSGIRCRNSTNSHGISTHTFPTNQDGLRTLGNGGSFLSSSDKRHMLFMYDLENIISISD